MIANFLAVGVATLFISAVVLLATIDYLFADLNDQGEPEECDQ